jgi:hypothetical protein
MPSFAPFRFFGTFPKIANETLVPWLGEFGGNQSNSTITTAAQSLPIWWLLYRMRFNVDISLTTPPEISPSKSGSANFDMVFTSPDSPNIKICRESNIINGEGEVENANLSGDWLAGPVDYSQFTLAPFACESLHVNFYCQITGISSIAAEAYITSSENSLGADDDGPPPEGNVENLNFQTFTITPPNSPTPVTLYGAVNVYQYDSGSGIWLNSGSGSIALGEVEWWEVE